MHIWYVGLWKNVVSYLPEVLEAAEQKYTIFIYINMSLA